MDKALSLPEIVSNVLGNFSTYFIRDLRSSLYVNHLFSYEAARILWSTCGRYNEYDRAPRIGTLGVIAKKSRDRGQYYANFIQAILVTRASEAIPDQWGRGFRHCCGHCPDDIVPYFDALRRLRFPKLNSISVRGLDLQTDRKVYAHLARLGAHEFRVTAGKLFNDLLSNLCGKPSLKMLQLRSMHCKSATEKAMVQFLRNSPSLKTLMIQFCCANHRCWSKKIFSALMDHPSLVDVYMPRIEESWIDGLAGENAGRIFSTMEGLVTALSSRSLLALAPSFQGIQSLDLDFTHFKADRNNEIFPALCRFPTLNAVDLTFDGSTTIEADQLLMFARSCPLIYSWAICRDSLRDGYEASTPVAKGISDSIVEEMAKCWPNLVRFKLFLRSCEGVTYRSLVSLGKHCPELEAAHFTARIDLHELAIQGPGTVSETLICLRVGDPLDDGFYFEREEPVALALEITGMFPSLQDLSEFDSTGLTDLGHYHEGYIEGDLDSYLESYYSPSPSYSDLFGDMDDEDELPALDA